MDVKGLIEEFERMDETEQSSVVDFILGRTERKAESVQSFTAELRKRKGLHCPNCGCVDGINRFGFSRNGAQRFLCRSCKKTFTASSGTIASRTRQDLRTWRSFFKCMERGMSCRKTAKECGIHYVTAFRWRHAVLDSVRLAESERSEKLEGLVEADETFFRLSFKGMRNLKASVGRNAHRRGGEVSSRGLSSSQVCVPTILSRSGRSFAKAACLGSVSVEALKFSLEGRMASGSTLCTDSAGAYKRFASSEGLHHVPLKGKGTRIGVYGLQRMNAYHANLKRFLYPFQGVSTKYLNNYLAWNAELRNDRKSESGFASHLMEVAFGTRGKMNVRGYMVRPQIPVVGNKVA